MSHPIMPHMKTFVVLSVYKQYYCNDVKIYFNKQGSHSNAVMVASGITSLIAICKAQMKDKTIRTIISFLTKVRVKSYTATVI